MDHTYSFESLKQIEGETNRAYTCFLDYIELGPSRSIRSLCAHYKEQSADKPPTIEMSTIAKWSSSNRWQERVKGYLEELRVYQATKQAERLEQFNEYNWETFSKLANHVTELADSFADMKITKRKRIPNPAKPNEDMEVVYMKTNVGDLQRLVSAFGALSKDLRAALGLAQSVDITSAGQALKSYTVISPDDWDNEPDGDAL